MRDNILQIDIGNIQILLCFDDEFFFIQNKNKYLGFINQKRKLIQYSVKIEVQYKKNGDFNVGLVTDADISNACLHSSGTKTTVCWREFYGEFDICTKDGWVICSHQSGLESFLRFVYSILLLQESGFFVHAASFIKNGKGYLFPGKSGSGKTTIARNSTNTTLLTDELSLIKKMSGEFHLFGTPFWGDLTTGGTNTHSVASSVYFHQKDNKVFSKAISISESLAKLLPNVVFWSNDKNLKKQLFDLCVDFVNSTPRYDLHFLSNPSFWNVIE